MSEFTHLHNHFDIGSPKDSSCKIDETIKYVKSLGFTAYAITDHARIDGWVPFNIACKKHNIKGIYGVELYEAERKASDKALGIDNKRYHSVMLAKNQKGIQFLRKLVTFSFLRENVYYKPRYDLEYLEKHKNEIKGNIIWMSACVQGRIPQYLKNKKEKEAKEYIDKIIDIFGEENVFIEIQDHGIEKEKIILPRLIKFSKKYNLQIVATNDIHYIKKEHYIAREIMIAREQKQTIEERKNNGDILPSELYIKSEEEMFNLFKSFPEAIKNTKKIVDMCENIDLEEKKWHFPNFEIPKGYTINSYLEKKVYDEIPKKYPNLTPQEKKELMKKTQFEIETICNMTASAYMLIVSDFITESKKRNIMVGPGRGSACGSIVAYALNITEIDPLKYELFFERFMNPERVNMPDIDTDFQDDKRAEIIKYVVNKYGKDKVAQIITYGTEGARMAIRDTGAVFEIDSKFVDKVAKSIPLIPGITLNEALKQSPQFNDFYKTSIGKTLIDNAKMIEGLVRHTGVHAAGILISDEPLEKYGALIEAEDSDIPIFAGDMKAVDYLKLLKMDFLGLKTLRVIKNTKNMVEANTNIKVDFKDFNDPKVFEFISRGQTHGVFQLEQPGMQNFMKELQPNNIEDIILGISVYRPGPMDSIPLLLEGKKNPASIKYPSDAKHLLAPILDITYGVIVYQEQVMQIVRELAGYSFGRSDLVRRAMSKKKQEIMEAERYVFVYGEVKCPHCKGTGKNINGDNCILCKGAGAVASRIKCPWCKGKNKTCTKCDGKGILENKGETTIEGCLNKGISEKTANYLFDKMIDFAAYAFNKSHATAYAIIAYQTAYLKYYYPKQYTTAYLNSISDQKKIKKYIGIAKKEKIPVLKADINKSNANFTQDDEGIYTGLLSLKNIGKNIEKIIQERERSGKFKSLQDFIERVDLNKREFEALVKSGTLDCFGYNRSQMLSATEKIISYGKEHKEIKNSGQISFFDFKNFEKFKNIELPNINEFSPMEKYSMEKEISGFYLSGHPLCLFKKHKNFEKQSNITTIDIFNKNDDRKKIKIIGIIEIGDKEGIKISKSGKQYAVFQIEDEYSSIDVIVFENVLKKHKDLIQNENIVQIIGCLSVQINEIENNEGDITQDIKVQIIANKIKLLTDVNNFKKVYVCVDGKLKYLNLLKNIIDKNPGKDNLYICNKGKVSKSLKTFNCNKKTQEQIKEIFGDLVIKN